MRISLVSVHTSPSETPGKADAGGMNVVVSEAAAALAEIGHRVTIFTRASAHVAPGERPLTDHDSGGGGRRGSVTLVALPVGEQNVQKSDLPGLVPTIAETLAAHPSFLSSEVVHSHYWLSGMVVSLALQSLHERGASPIPHVTSLHTVAAQKNANLGPNDRREPEERLDGERRLIREAFVVAGSASELDGIRAGYGDPELGSRVIYPGVDTDLFAPSVSPAIGAEPEHDRLQLAMIGRVQPHKGQDLALDAFASYVARGGTGELTIAGEPTPDAVDWYQNLRERARQFGDAVHFRSALSRSDTAALLRSSDVVLIPSRSETFGLIAVESAASGTPVIASRTTGLEEAVIDGVSGVLIDDRDPHAWAREIMHLDADRDELARLGRSARASVTGRDWHHHAVALANCYSHLIASYT